MAEKKKDIKEDFFTYIFKKDVEEIEQYLLTKEYSRLKETKKNLVSRVMSCKRIDDKFYDFDELKDHVPVIYEWLRKINTGKCKYVNQLVDIIERIDHLCESSDDIIIHKRKINELVNSGQDLFRNKRSVRQHSMTVENEIASELSQDSKQYQVKKLPTDQKSVVQRSLKMLERYVQDYVKSNNPEDALDIIDAIFECIDATPVKQKKPPISANIEEMWTILHPIYSKNGMLWVLFICLTAPYYFYTLLMKKYMMYFLFREMLHSYILTIIFKTDREFKSFDDHIFINDGADWVGPFFPKLNNCDSPNQWFECAIVNEFLEFRSKKLYPEVKDALFLHSEYNMSQKDVVQLVIGAVSKRVNVFSNMKNDKTPRNTDHTRKSVAKKDDKVSSRIPPNTPSSSITNDSTKKFNFSNPGAEIDFLGPPTAQLKSYNMVNMINEPSNVSVTSDDDIDYAYQFKPVVHLHYPVCLGELKSPAIDKYSKFLADYRSENYDDYSIIKETLRIQTSSYNVITQAIVNLCKNRKKVGDIQFDIQEVSEKGVKHDTCIVKSNVPINETAWQIINEIGLSRFFRFFVSYMVLIPLHERGAHHTVEIHGQRLIPISIPTQSKQFVIGKDIASTRKQFGFKVGASIIHPDDRSMCSNAVQDVTSYSDYFNAVYDDTTVFAGQTLSECNSLVTNSINAKCQQRNHMTVITSCNTIRVLCMDPLSPPEREIKILNKLSNRVTQKTSEKVQITEEIKSDIKNIEEQIEKIDNTDYMTIISEFAQGNFAGLGHLNLNKDEALCAVSKLVLALHRQVKLLKNRVALLEEQLENSNSMTIQVSDKAGRVAIAIFNALY